MKRIFSWGVAYYNANDELHRDDGPAIEYSDGTKLWWKNGKIHRDDGPAVEYPSGDMVWYRNGYCYKSAYEFFEQKREEEPTISKESISKLASVFNKYYKGA